ncbi:hypothetical protein BT69DRAFT_1311007 [Atractiella rhizophila]|nr:hypothetical protein BT69DRAFT_1311007 [Atractiella rhizophila]
MLILDVRTRWGSTHDMLDLGLRYKDVIETYSNRHELPSMLHLSEKEWNSVEQVCKWLAIFRQATYDMSMNKASCLSQTLGVYHSLLGFLKEEISRLTNTVVDKEYRQALLDCYYKLSDYHYRSDLSPYYIYAIICDPRLGVSFLDSSVFDSESDEIEQHKQNFINLFRYQYYKAPSTSSQPIPSQLQPLPKSMKGRVNLTANFLATIRQGPGAGAEDAVMKEINYLFRFEALAWDSDPLAFWK